MRSAEVLITWPDYPVGERALGSLLTARGLAIRLEPRRQHRTPAEVRELARRAVGAIVSTDPFDASVFAGCPDLRVIARVGVGVDSVDLDAASAAGVAVTTTPGANESTVADHTVGLMLAVLRRVAEHDAGVRRGEWNRTGRHVPWDLAGSTVGLVGYGSIGRLVARRLEGFDVRLLVTDPAEPEGDDAEVVSLPDLLRAAHVVSLHAPLVAGTRNLIGSAELALMRRDAVLVNTSRGGLVDQHALADALIEGRIRGAALDVFVEEPPLSTRLLSLPNVVMTPHVGGISERSVAEMTLRATESVLRVLDGQVPDNLANPGVLDHARFAGVSATVRTPASSGTSL